MRRDRRRAVSVLMMGPMAAGVVLFACSDDDSQSPFAPAPSNPDTGAPETSFNPKLGSVTISIVGNGEVTASASGTQFMDCTGTNGVKSGSCLVNTPSGHGTGAYSYTFNIKPAKGWVIQDTGYEYGDNPIHDTGTMSTVTCMDSANVTLFVTFVAVEAGADGGTDAPAEAAPSNATISVSSANGLFPTQTVTNITCGDSYAYLDVPAAVASALALPSDTYLGFFQVTSDQLSAYVKSGNTLYYDGRTAGVYNSGTIPPIAMTNSAGGGATVTDTINVSGTYTPCP